MQNTKKITIRLTIMLAMLFIAFACQDNGSNVKEPEQVKFSVRPADERIKNEILGMAGLLPKKGEVKNGIVAPPAPNLPTGYDYANLQEIVLSGATWQTFVAWKTTGNTATYKDAIAFTYSGGVYKNNQRVTWSNNTTTNKIQVRHYLGGAETYNSARLYTLIKPLDNVIRIDESFNGKTNCGGQAIACATDIYTNHGYGSLFFTAASFYAPEIALAVLGGCLLGCLI